jgi:hypothetical protein
MVSTVIRYGIDSFKWQRPYTKGKFATAPFLMVTKTLRESESLDLEINLTRLTMFSMQGLGCLGYLTDRAGNVNI